MGMDLQLPLRSMFFDGYPSFTGCWLMVEEKSFLSDERWAPWAHESRFRILRNPGKLRNVQIPRGLDASRDLD